MASPVLPKIPIIDLYKEESKLGAISWLSACQSVCHALEEYGCFVAVYDNVSLELHNQIFGALKDLFGLPTEPKPRNLILLNIWAKGLNFLSTKGLA